MSASPHNTQPNTQPDSPKLRRRIQQRLNKITDKITNQITNQITDKIPQNLSRKLSIEMQVMNQRVTQQVNQASVQATTAMLQAAVAGMRATKDIAPALSAQAAVALFRWPRRTPRRSYEQRLLNKAERLTVYWKGKQVPVWRWVSKNAEQYQTAPHILLVHGWEGRGSQLAYFVEPLLAKGYTVVTFDQPGHGDASAALVGLPDMAEVLPLVAEAVQMPLGDFAGIITHSLGSAATALALSRVHQARAEQGMYEGHGVNHIPKLPRLSFIAPPFGPRMAIRNFVEMTKLGETVEAEMQKYLENHYKNTMQALDIAEIAPKLPTPALIVHDHADRYVPYEVGAALAQKWPTAFLHTTNGLGHHRILDDQAVIDTVLSFITNAAPEKYIRLAF